MHLSFEVFWWLISSNGCYFCARQRHLFRLPQHSQWQHGLFLPTRLRLQAQGFLQHWEDFPAGTAIELSANGKTINLLVTDLCPSSSNAHHTSKANYFFDLQKSAFTTLADESVGELQMTFKVIPYPTSKNIGFISTTTQEWYLQGRFFNMRYPLKKIEWSLDGGTTFSEMSPVACVKNNLCCINWSLHRFFVSQPCWC